MLKKSVVLALITAFAMTSELAVASKGRIGIAFPTQNESAWYSAGPSLVNDLKKRGYDTVLYYGGDNDVPIQQRQISRMLNEDKVNAMIVAPIDANILLDQLKPVKKAGVPVISFDRLIMYSDAVKYYVAFDNSLVGKMQAQSIIDALKLDERSSSDPAYLEIVGGAPKDKSVEGAYNGFLSMILPYIDDGKLVVPSDQFFLNMVTVKDGSSDNALKRIDELISKQGYGPKGKKLDAVYCSSDTVADGVVRGLKKTGYTSENMPFLCGRDATESQLKGILAGERGSTIYRDPNKLNDSAARIIDALMSGKQPEINDTSSYNNGLDNMNSVVCEPVLVDRNNIKTLFPDLHL